MYIDTNDPRANQLVQAIHRGNIPTLERLLAEHPNLATARLGTHAPGAMSRTLLHVVTDWPGHFPNGAATVKLLLANGADANARFTGPHTETPLHWAASSDDVEVLDALLDGGADIEAPGAVIGDGSGTPLSDAVAFAQWHAARRLVERGAKTLLWHAAALGHLDRVQADFNAAAQPSPSEITQAFWCACHGGQHVTAEYLLAKGAELNWIGFDNMTPLDAARRNGAYGVLKWLHTQGAKMTEQLTGNCQQPCS